MRLGCASPGASRGRPRETWAQHPIEILESKRLRGAHRDRVALNCEWILSGSVAAHLNFAPRTVSILNDDAWEIQDASVDAQLHGSKRALPASMYGVMVQVIVYSPIRRSRAPREVLGSHQYKRNESSAHFTACAKAHLRKAAPRKSGPLHDSLILRGGYWTVTLIGGATGVAAGLVVIAMVVVPVTVRLSVPLADAAVVESPR